MENKTDKIAARLVDGAQLVSKDQYTTSTIHRIVPACDPAEECEASLYILNDGSPKAKTVSLEVIIRDYFILGNCGEKK